MEEKPYSSIQLSGRMFTALKLFTDRKTHSMSVEEAITVDQRTFGPIYHRGYIKYNSASKQFVLTETGRASRLAFEAAEVVKDKPSAQFSHYIRALRALKAFKAAARNYHGRRRNYRSTSNH